MSTNKNKPNPLEILEVKAFEKSELPKQLSHGMTEVLERAAESLHAKLGNAGLPEAVSVRPANQSGP